MHAEPDPAREPSRVHPGQRARGRSLHWRYIYIPEYGLINQFLRAIGLEELCRAWTADPDTALGAVIVTNTWRYAGFTMVLYYVAMLDIPKDVLESAQIDGANPWQALVRIKLPMVMSSVTICLFLSLTNSFKLFDQNLSLTGGEPNHASEMLALNIYNTFYTRSGPQWKGIGQAKAVIFFVLVVAIALVQLRATRSREVQQ